MAAGAETGPAAPAEPAPPEPDDATRRLLDAASAVYGRLGYEQGSLREIADIAGFTTGAISSRWRTKRDLFAAVVEHNFGPVLLDALRGAGLPPMDTLQTIASNLLNRDPDRDAIRDVRVMACSAAGNDTELRPAVARSVARENDDLAATAAEAQAAGELDPEFDPRVFAFCCQAVAFGVHLMRRILDDEQGLPSDEEWRAFMARLYGNMRPSPQAPADD